MARKISIDSQILCIKIKGKAKSHLVHRISLLGSRSESDVSIVGRLYPELDLPGRHGIEMVLQLVLGGKRCKVEGLHEAI